MGNVCREHAAFKESKRSRGNEEEEGGGSLDRGQLEVKLLGAVQNSHLHNRQEDRQSVAWAGLVGFEGNRLVRQIEKQCEGM